MHMCYKIFTPLGYGVVACQKQRLGPKLEGAGPGEHPIIWDPLHISATVEASKFKFGTQLGFGTSLPKNVLIQNWRGSGPGEHPKKFGTPYVFLQPLKLAISNLVHKLGLGLAYRYQKRLKPKLAGVWVRGASENIWDPLFISATVEARD